MAVRLISSIALLSSLFFGSNGETDTTSSTPANILFIMLDDLGRADIGKYGAEWETPNIDKFIDESVYLSRHYIGFVCSASRSQFLTGRYSYHNGYGALNVFDREKIGGIPVGTPTVANYLSTYANYETYAIGKWQLGYSFAEQTPNYRGFNYFYGFYGGMEDYYNKSWYAMDQLPEDWFWTIGAGIKTEIGGSSYLDFFENNEPHYQGKGTYSTIQYANKIIDIIGSHSKEKSNDPFYIYAALQAPHLPFPTENSIFKEACKGKYEAYYADLFMRDGICEAILGVDYALGLIIDYLKTPELAKVWENTLVVFTSDNGGAVPGSCNYPLRGGKNTFFEGGQRVPTFVGGGILPDARRGTELRGLMSNVDWLPTLLSYANLIPTDYSKFSVDKSFGSLSINENNPLTFDGYNFYTYLMDHNGIGKPLRDHIIFQLAPSKDDNLISSKSGRELSVLTETQQRELSKHTYKYYKYHKIHKNAYGDTNEEDEIQDENGVMPELPEPEHPEEEPIDGDLPIPNKEDPFDVLSELDLSELAIIFYDDDGNFWKYLNTEVSANPVGDPGMNSDWCTLSTSDDENDISIYEYKGWWTAISKGLWDLTNDEQETTDLLEMSWIDNEGDRAVADEMSAGHTKEIEIDQLEKLMNIVKEKASFYLDTESSDSARYLSISYDCFYDSYETEAWPGNVGDVWAPFLDTNQFERMLKEDCGLHESHQMFRLHTEPFELPDTTKVGGHMLPFIDDKSSIVDTLNMRVPLNDIEANNDGTDETDSTIEMKNDEKQEEPKHEKQQTIEEETRLPSAGHSNVDIHSMIKEMEEKYPILKVFEENEPKVEAQEKENVDIHSANIRQHINTKFQIFSFINMMLVLFAVIMACVGYYILKKKQKPTISKKSNDQLGNYNRVPLQSENDAEKYGSV